MRTPWAWTLNTYLLHLWSLRRRRCRRALAAHVVDDTNPLYISTVICLLSIALLQLPLYPCQHSRREYCLSISFLVGRLVECHDLCGVEERMDIFLGHTWCVCAGFGWVLLSVINFIRKCAHESTVIRSVASHGVQHGRNMSCLGQNVLFYMRRHDCSLLSTIAYR